MPLKSEYFPEQSSQSNPPSVEVFRSYRRILYGIFGVYAATVASLTGAVIVGTSFQKAAHIAMAALH